MKPRVLLLLAALLAAPVAAGQTTPPGGGHSPGSVSSGGGSSGGGELPKVGPVAGGPTKPVKPSSKFPPAGGTVVTPGWPGGGQSPGGGSGGGGTGGGGTGGGTGGGGGGGGGGGTGGGGGGGCGGGHGHDGAVVVGGQVSAGTATDSCSVTPLGSPVLVVLRNAALAPVAGELVLVLDAHGRALAAGCTDAQGLLLLPAPPGARILIPSAAIEWPLRDPGPLVVILPP